MYVNAGATLTYPANASVRSAQVDESRRTEPELFDMPHKTNNSAVYVLDMTTMKELKGGDEVAIMNTSREVYGVGVIDNNGFVAVTVWGDDELTETKDGAAENENLIIVAKTQNGDFIDNVA